MTKISAFFNEMSEQSRVKAIIVSKYFYAWARVMLGHFRKNYPSSKKPIAYIDLFSGPGLYKEGTESTPLLILRKAIDNSELRERLATFFVDKNDENIRLLREAVGKLPSIGLLKFPPQIECLEVGPDIARFFAGIKLPPTLFFIDPWGYKGLSLELISSLVKDWGCDCIFFFNYRRINMSLNNPLFEEHMISLFGEERSESLNPYLKRLSVQQREMTIIEALCQALNELGLTYTLPFRFLDDRGTRTSHHLIFVSKAYKGYEIMKNIMAKECSGEEQGVPSFEYNPIDARNAELQPLLFQLSRSIDDLEEMLINEFAGQTTTMKDLYEKHNVGRSFIRKNYSGVLQKLEREKKISVPKHRKGTFGDNIRITFPLR